MRKKIFTHKDDFIRRNTYRLTKFKIVDTNANSTTTTIVTDILYINGTKNRYHQANPTTLQYPRSPQIDHYLAKSTAIILNVTKDKERFTRSSGPTAKTPTSEKLAGISSQD